jgi:Transcriptional Coactivator p15 (PC4)
MPNTDKLVAEIPKNPRESIRVTLAEIYGKEILSIRVWFKAEDGGWRPGKSGIAFRLDLLPAVAEALALAVTQARATGLLPPDNVRQLSRAPRRLQ